MMNPGQNVPSIAESPIFDEAGVLKQIPIFKPEPVAKIHVPEGEPAINEMGVRTDVFGWNFEIHAAFPDAPPPPAKYDPLQTAICPFCAEVFNGGDVLCRTLPDVAFKYRGYVYMASFFYRYHPGCYDINTDTIISGTVSSLRHVQPDEWNLDKPKPSGKDDDGRELAGV